MDQLIVIGAGIFGAIIGSFLNVVILRSFTGRSLNGRSGCATCGKSLAWHELIPVVSFLLQGGKCRGCDARISWQYISVELLTAVLFILVVLQLNVEVTTRSILTLMYFFAIMSLLVVISVYDIKHKIIPNVFVYLLITLSFVFVILDFTPLRLLAGPLLWLPFASLWFFSKGKWIGLGDAKLVWSFGWMLGLAQGLSAVVFGFWLGAVIGVTIIIVRRIRYRNRINMKTEIPFGPFLVAGFLLVLFTGVSATEAIHYILTVV